MIRPSLTFISIFIILFLSGCSSIPIADDFSIEDVYEEPYTYEMINDYEELSKELQNEIAFILEEIFFYNQVNVTNLEKINNFIKNGQIKDQYVKQIQLIVLNKNKLQSVQSINVTYKTSKKVEI